MEAVARRGAADTSPVLPFEELSRLSLLEGGAGVRCQRLLSDRIRGRPDLFRVLDPWRGPLRTDGRRAEASPDRTRLLAGGGLPAQGWVVPLLGGPEAAWDSARDPRPGERIRLRLRQTVRSLARSTDADSLTALLRLGRILREERALRGLDG